MLYSCATSLDRSQVDRVMRFEGSYTCESLSLEPAGRKETLAQADASRVRCARDSWAVQGNQVYFTRSLYQTRNCEVPLGKIQFNTEAERLANGIALQGSVPCEVVRTNLGWVGERSGKCLLKDLRMNHAYPIKNLNCHNYIPAICKSESTRLELTADLEELDDEHREPVSQLTVEGISPAMRGVCKRYAAE